MHDPYWRANTSFSPSSGFDFRLHSDGFPNVLRDGEQLYVSSSSSSSKGSGMWVNEGHLDGVEFLVNSSSDMSQGPRWIPPAIQEINFEDHETSSKRDLGLQRIYSPAVAGTSADRDSMGSYSSHSESSESEAALTSCHRNMSSYRFFAAKPIHPLSFPNREVPSSHAAGPSKIEGSTGLSTSSAWKNGSSCVNFMDSSVPLECNAYGRGCVPSDAFRCGMCERYLSQKSPWSTRRIIRSGDMPVAGVLSCRHVFHAECLEQTTPKARKNDPPCPLCVKVDEGTSQELRAFAKLKTGPPRPRTFLEDGPSRPWGCLQVGDCVDGALNASPRNAMMLLNRSRLKRNLSLKGASSKEFSGKSRKPGIYPPEVSRPADQNQSTLEINR
ncbi:hypothetical protein MLD38_016998 [Melastoma candidum]|uniref:Uncharacterized protein n=1 Tax=Melastoma candidum TaxID=119954 RepID=A0ACB9QR30_9MYRT|nr:hypothetical protein MLD38_016998 [Melastoma candidum]